MGIKYKPIIVFVFWFAAWVLLGILNFGLQIVAKVSKIYVNKNAKAGYLFNVCYGVYIILIRALNR